MSAVDVVHGHAATTLAQASDIFTCVGVLWCKCGLAHTAVSSTPAQVERMLRRKFANHLQIVKQAGVT